MQVRCDRSRLLQAARFFVRNAFLQGGVSSDSLRYPDESSGTFSAAAALPPLEDVLREAAAAEAELDADMDPAGQVPQQGLNLKHESGMDPEYILDPLGLEDEDGLDERESGYPGEECVKGEDEEEVGGEIDE